MADVPVWIWQVLGAVCGLALGIWLGALRQPKSEPRVAGAAGGGASPSSAGAAAVAPPAPSPAAAPAAAQAAAARPAAASQTAGNGTSAGANAEAAGAVDLAQQRLLQRLRESNIELSNKLKALTEGQSRDLERNQQAHLDQQRFERQLEEARQKHAQELSELMAVLVQQVDGIHKEHAAQVRKLEAELERLRRSGDPSGTEPPPRPPAAAAPSTRR